MRRPPNFRRHLSKRDIALQRRAMDEHYAALADVEPVFAGDIEIPPPPKKRVKHDTDESPIQKQIMEYLAWHPQIVWRIRINSGVLGDNFVRTHYGLASDELLSDIIFMLRGGRFGACEVKRSGWTKPRNEREEKQANFHEHVRAAGGIGFFAASLDEAKERLTAALSGIKQQEKFALI